jgi:chaperone required for assembly of F1-ATPase
MAERTNPATAAQRLARRELPRRFYKDVGVATQDDGRYALLLDGRIAKTPGRKPLAVDRRAVAEAVATEWRGQKETVDPAAMPVTRLVNAAVDRVLGEMPAVRAEIVKYAQSDLVCYRAAGPDRLAAAQDAEWSPLVAWAKDALGAALRLGTGVVHVPQDRAVAEAVAAAIAPLAALPLAALHLATTLTGSAIIGLALLHGRLTPDAAWSAAHVDEDWQMSEWGADELALAARAARRRDFDAAALVLAAE